jgi:hypothetical protein
VERFQPVLEDGGEFQPVLGDGGEFQPVLEDGGEFQPVLEDDEEFQPAMEDAEEFLPDAGDDLGDKGDAAGGGVEGEGRTKAVISMFFQFCDIYCTSLFCCLLNV